MQLRPHGFFHILRGQVLELPIDADALDRLVHEQQETCGEHDGAEHRTGDGTDPLPRELRELPALASLGAAAHVAFAP